MGRSPQGRSTHCGHTLLIAASEFGIRNAFNAVFATEVLQLAIGCEQRSASAARQHEVEHVVDGMIQTDAFPQRF